MYKILDKRLLADHVQLFKIHAPDIANKAKPGQFVIMRIDEKGERIPLTLVDWEKGEGAITVIFQEIGVSTRKLGLLSVNDEVPDVLGPLGNPSDIKPYSPVAVVSGGVGTAVAYCIAKALKEEGNEVTSIVGARTKDLLILEDAMRKVSTEFHVSTDDGSKGAKGFVSDVLKTLIEKGRKFSIVYAVGPVPMMRAVAETTRPYGIKTIASLNSIMIDGMGMCGSCRVTVGGETKFACVDGPEFDAHKVDFAELMKRQAMFQSQEKLALQHWENERCGHLDRA